MNDPGRLTYMYIGRERFLMNDRYVDSRIYKGTYNLDSQLTVSHSLSVLF